MNIQDRVAVGGFNDHQLGRRVLRYEECEAIAKIK